MDMQEEFVKPVTQLPAIIFVAHLRKCNLNIQCHVIKSDEWTMYTFLTDLKLLTNLEKLSYFIHKNNCILIKTAVTNSHFT